MKQTLLSVTRLGFVLAALGAASSLAMAQGSPRPAQSVSAAGLWEQTNDDGSVGGWFYIFDRGDGIFEGRIVKTFPKPGSPPNPVCTQCPGDQRGKPMLGLTLIKNMQRKGLAFENGSILDPRDGNVYNARMEVSPDGQRLALRGYLGIELFGKTQTWRRLPETAMAEVASVIGPQQTQQPTQPSRQPPAPQRR